MKINKTIFSLTSSRSDFYILSKLLTKIQFKFYLKLIVCGNHLSNFYGKTVINIKKKKIKDIKKFKLENNSNKLIKRFFNYLKKNRPKLVLILGDRFESYCLAVACSSLKITVFHISGGDTSLGSKDEFYRDYISKISKYHFVKTLKQKKKLIKIGIKNNIYIIGSLVSENLNLIKKNNFNKVKKPYVLVSYHPVTNEKLLKKDLKLFNIFKITKKFKFLNFVFTASNHDKGGVTLNKKIINHCNVEKNCFFFKNLGDQYLSAIKNSKFMLGNSSSGIIESSFFNKYSINILPRQLGRECGKNVINVNNNFKEIKQSIENILYKRKAFTKQSIFDQRKQIGSPVNFIIKKITSFLNEKN